MRKRFLVVAGLAAVLVAGLSTPAYALDDNGVFDSTIRFQDAHGSESCLYEQPTTSGHPVSVSPNPSNCTSSAAQWFGFNDGTIRSYYDGGCLTAHSGALPQTVFVTACDAGNPRQKWGVMSVAGSSYKVEELHNRGNDGWLTWYRPVNGQDGAVRVQSFVGNQYQQWDQIY